MHFLTSTVLSLDSNRSVKSRINKMAQFPFPTSEMLSDCCNTGLTASFKVLQRIHKERAHQPSVSFATPARCGSITSVQTVVDVRLKRNTLHLRMALAPRFQSIRTKHDPTNHCVYIHILLRKCSSHILFQHAERLRSLTTILFNCLGKSYTDNIVVIYLFTYLFFAFQSIINCSFIISVKQN